MNLRRLPRPALPALLLLLLSTPALAQATRTWVSGVGDDVNPCSRTAPCKTFAGAISKTAAGGEIDALDPGGYGAVTITKSMTLDGSHTHAGLLAPGTNAVVVNAGATGVVVLRGLSIQGAGQGLAGIRVVSAKAVYVEGCVIRGFQNGIQVADAAGAQLFVRDTVVSDNSQANVQVLSGQALLQRAELSNAPVGLDAAGTARATLHDSTVSGHPTAGIRAQGTSEVNMERGMVALNGVGIQADAPVRISEVMVSHNTTGLAGSVTSFGNNRVAAGNGADGAPSSTLPQQ
jgi:hypothetical protein